MDHQSLLNPAERLFLPVFECYTGAALGYVEQLEKLVEPVFANAATGGDNLSDLETILQTVTATILTEYRIKRIKALAATLQTFEGYAALPPASKAVSYGGWKTPANGWNPQVGDVVVVNAVDKEATIVAIESTPGGSTLYKLDKNVGKYPAYYKAELSPAPTKPAQPVAWVPNVGDKVRIMEYWDEGEATVLYVDVKGSETLVTIAEPIHDVSVWFLSSVVPATPVEEPQTVAYVETPSDWVPKIGDKVRVLEFWEEGTATVFALDFKPPEIELDRYIGGFKFWDAADLVLVPDDVPF